MIGQPPPLGAHDVPLVSEAECPSQGRDWRLGDDAVFVQHRVQFRDDALVQRHLDRVRSGSVDIPGIVALAPAPDLAFEAMEVPLDREHQTRLVAFRVIVGLLWTRRSTHAGGRRVRRKPEPLGNTSLVPGSPAACMAARNASVAAAQRSATEPDDPPPATLLPACVLSHSARVGSRSTAARLRPHAVQNIPTPGVSPQNGQTRTSLTIPALCQPTASDALRPLATASRDGWRSAGRRFYTGGPLGPKLTLE